MSDLEDDDESRVFIDEEFLDSDLYEDLFDEDEEYDEQEELLEEGLSIDEESEQDMYDRFGNFDDED